MENKENHFPLDAITDEFLDALPFAMSWVELPGATIRFVNRAFVEAFGYPADSFKTADEFVDGTYVSEKQRVSCREYWKHFTLPTGMGLTAVPEIEVDILRADGSICTAVHSGIIVPSHGVGVAFYKDISNFKRERRMLKRYAYADALTGLANRQALMERWQEESRLIHADRLALLMIDLDGFKPINDTYGHAAGDEALKIVARRIEEATREQDLVCRFGGDEFVILMRAQDDRSVMEAICERLVTVIGQPMPINDITVAVTASIGGCSYPDQAENIHQLFQQTDRAMYRAKRTGKSG